MESEVESIISPNPHNKKIYCNQVIVVETKFYQTEKLNSGLTCTMISIFLFCPLGDIKDSNSKKNCNRWSMCVKV